MAHESTTSSQEELRSLGTAVDAIMELEVFVSLCWDGLGYAELGQRLVDFRAELGAAPEYIAKRREHAKKLEAFAAAQKLVGFPYLYGLASIRLWTIMEVFAEDLFTDLVALDPTIRALPKIKGLKGPLVEFATAPASKQTGLLFSLLTSELAAPLKRGVGFFESVFDAIQLGGPVEDVVRRCFAELQEVRNVVAHRRGFADERFVMNCPWYGARAGELLQIPPPRFENYILAGYWYLLEVSRRISVRYPSESARTLVPSLDACADLQADIARVLRTRLGAQSS